MSTAGDEVRIIYENEVRDVIPSEGIVRLTDGTRVGLAEVRIVHEMNADAQGVFQEATSKPLGSFVAINNAPENHRVMKSTVTGQPQSIISVQLF